MNKPGWIEEAAIQFAADRGLELVGWACNRNERGTPAGRTSPSHALYGHGTWYSNRFGPNPECMACWPVFRAAEWRGLEALLKQDNP